MTKGNALIGQSGGPTSVINSSLAGVIETALPASFIGNIYGMQFGIEGFMQEKIFDLGRQPRNVIAGLAYGVEGMRAGGRRRIRVAPHLAYRDAGVPARIPANAVLIFDVALLHVFPR